MIGYVKNKSQEGRILALLRDRGSKGVEVYELVGPKPDGLGISQYNARIWGLRKKGFIIVNDPIGHFVLNESEENRPKRVVFDPVTCVARLI